MSDNSQNTTTLDKVLPINQKILTHKNKHYYCGPTNDICPHVCMYMTIIVPPILYYVMAAKNVSPILSVAIGILFILSMAFFLKTAYMDPGILPNHNINHIMSTEEENVEVKVNKHNRLIKVHNLEYASQIGRDGFCRTCDIIKPERSHHCNECGACVSLYDHHCPFVSNCVGERNLIYFHTFLCFEVCLGLCIVIGFILSANSDDNSNSNFEKIVVICVLSILGLLLIGGMVFGGYHLYLSLSGQTTKEHLKKLRPKGVRRSVIQSLHVPSKLDKIYEIKVSIV